MKIVIYDINNNGLEVFNFLKDKFPNNEFTFIFDKDSRNVNLSDEKILKSLIDLKVKPLSEMDYDLILITSKEVFSSLNNSKFIYASEYKTLTLSDDGKPSYRVVEFLNGNAIETCLI